MAKPQLPDDLRQALLKQPGPVCSALIVNDIGSVIVKTSASDINGFRGPVPILYRYELGRYPEGSAIRLYLEIQDRPDEPYRLDAFLNPATDADLTLLRRLREQTELHIHFFNMKVRYQYSKSIRHRQQQRDELARLIRMALDHLQSVPMMQRDWTAVKTRYQRDMPL
jgi:hypothetical protein